MTAENRHKLDDRCYQLWLAGASRRAIGKQVGLFCRGAELAIERRLDEISAEAETKNGITYLRFEGLLRPLRAKAMAGDLRASEQARCLLMAQAKLAGDFQSDRMTGAQKLDARNSDADMREGGIDPDPLERYRTGVLFAY